MCSQEREGCDVPLGEKNVGSIRFFQARGTVLLAELNDNESTIQYV